ncbi:MAG: two-CW domain-containing protein [Candidatus Methylomirabilia bacterium]
MSHHFNHNQKEETLKNCWEFKKCGRQPQGSHVHDLGVCPAALEEALDGTHDGTNAGRACWVVAGTLCGGVVQGTFGVKYSSCEQCDFYQHVRTKQKGKFEMSVVLLSRMRSAKKTQLVDGR